MPLGLPNAFSTSTSTASSVSHTPSASIIDEDHTVTPASSATSPGTPADNANNIAVIGMGCRVPGGNNSPSELWDFLLKKGDASGDMPAMRWEAYHKRDPRNTETLNSTTSKGYFLDNLTHFDPGFFGISPREAEQIDPQQRLAVEVSWEALEDAGIPPQSLAGSDTAVYMGVNSDDYSRLLLEDIPNVEAWMGVGTAFCGVPNRVSYLLDLRGASEAVDAACASSLVAIHHARQALLAGETDLALAGGVNALIGPGLTRVLDKAGAISSDGRCRSFDDAAAGYGRGEGAGAVVLKRMADALRDQDRIYAVLKGSAVAADGRTNGIMAPNSEAQMMVARRALKAARVCAGSVGYVEAHATSTPIGDPTECSAMAGVYGSGARLPGSDPVLVGSIKSNIGHLEAGAGVMGFIKACLAVQKGLIPPQANLTKPNTKIDWKNSLLKVVTEATKWPASTHGPRRAAIASYGYGGTVSHAIIEAAPPSVQEATRYLSSFADRTKPALLLLSAPQANQLGCTTTKLARWLETKGEETSLQSVAHSLAAKKGHHTFRTAIVAENASDAIRLLDGVARKTKDPWMTHSRTLPKSANHGAVWLFSGHGAQWPAMGRELISDSAFADVLAQLEPIIQDEAGFSAHAALEAGDFDSTDKVQVLTYVMHVGLAGILQAKGIQPSAVIGHSMGEIAASVVAGALTAREGCLITCVRARLYREVMGKGAMVLVGMTYAEALKELKGKQDICAAISSSPTSCVVSGSVVAVGKFAVATRAKGIDVREVKTDVAFHSPALLPLVAPLREALEGRLMPRRPEIALYSTSLPGNPRGKAPRDVEYWVDNMVQPVLLTSAITAAAEDGFRIFVEVSSHPIISHSVEETLLDSEIDDAIVVPTMRRNKDAEKSLLFTLGKLHCAGASINFERLTSGGDWLHDLPRTEWNHQSYWRKVETGNTSAQRKVTHDTKTHVLTGAKTQICGSETVLWQTYLDKTVKPYPGSHFLHESEIVPAACLLNTFLGVAGGRSLKDVSLRVPVVVGVPREVQVLLEQNTLRISSRLINEAETASEQSWLMNTTTQLACKDEPLTTEKLDLEDVQRRLKTTLKETFSIDYLASVGVPDMGFPWKVLSHVENESEMLAKVDINPDATTIPWSKKSWAPILDAATSVSSTIFHTEPKLRMPTSIDRVIIRPETSSPKVGYIYVKKAKKPYAADVLVCDEEGIVAAEFQSMAFAGIEGDANKNKGTDGLVHQLVWPPAQLAEVPLSFKRVVFIASSKAAVEPYLGQLSRRSIETEVLPSPSALRPDMEDSIVVLIPNTAPFTDEIFYASSTSCETLLSTVKFLAAHSSSTKLFVLTNTDTLSHAPLHGLARIVASEHPDTWGGLIDLEEPAIFPLQAIKYVQGADMIRISDTVARTAHLRSFPKQTHGSQQNSLIPRLEGTYLITGGLGALGLEVASHLVSRGARRLILISRRQLPSRSAWKREPHISNPAIRKIQELEAQGCTIYSLPLDLSLRSSATALKTALETLNLPPVLGVVHAAGVLADQLVASTTKEKFDEVLAPKINGALALSEVFEPGSVDFMVFFSSCGQLLGFPGQASYASANAFLDALATYRRTQSHGDNTVSMLWTSWRGLGMAASTEYIDAELKERGITDVTTSEAFLAWDAIGKIDTDHAVVLRTHAIEADEAPAHPILADIVIRRPRPVATTTTEASSSGPAKAEANAQPKTAEEFEVAIKNCVASTLSLPLEAIDTHTTLSELGMDSVMAVGFRGRLQSALGVKVPPTLVWNAPTVGLLVKYFAGKK